ncbi:MAG: phosphate ABC transporter permease subunit PstC [Roseovarius sp.]|nr:phosphate ABC transporter permease subunit PstC [Roseovarius sp.]
MSIFGILLIVLVIASAGFVLGRFKVLRNVGGNIRELHSLPSYYGQNVFLKSAAPAFGLLAIWLIAQPVIIERSVSTMIPPSEIPEGSTMSLVMSEIIRTAEGVRNAVAAGAMPREMTEDGRIDIAGFTQRLKDAGQIATSDMTQMEIRATQRYNELYWIGGSFMTAFTIAFALFGLIWGLLESKPMFRARIAVEKGILILLIAAASLAIVTTLGIVLSLVFNTIEFFRLYPAFDFFLGLSWAPSFSGRGGASELGIAPLLWGTFYISFVALLVAVPIGLYSAIYLSEYAPPSVRSISKPLLEVLAGIPTIVYGLFALLTVGPLLVDVFGSGGILGVDWQDGGRSVATAGIVMGIMLIPFVSSLSDDIINAVPQAMRDGSYALGATKSETIRRVILPAALPGIVGAILLAASRAIGETMIVVLGAGAAARLDLNPFEAMTTVTAKIVSQLTGDSDFTSPEALVAFALGITLFVLTLGLNVFALYIVRKYREQYE